MTLQHHGVQVRKQGWPTTPWMLLCEHPECVGVSMISGVNCPDGWTSQSGALAAACRHVRRHLDD